ncbi:MAG: CocE/NonD family hydrolase [Caldilineaceae bacterium]
MPDLYEVHILYNVRIPTRDGLELSANLFMPVARQPNETFPAVLEMIPYRKDGWRYITDHRLMTYLAERGYVGCRLDIRGTGSSQGIAWDEYTVEETQDGYDAVEWLAAQGWCNGRVGMWGISYGGFTSIQAAMLQPPSLKAIVPVYATDDRYTDDVHYIGGCKTASELAQYAVSQVGMNALPPNTEYAGPEWSQQWRARLEQTPPWLLTWLRQQQDGPYWRNGSLAPDYGRIQCAMLLIGGWHDGYTNAVLRMMERCTAPRKAIIGNWVHQLPDYGYPGPTLDWLHEMVRFFDYWLKGEQNGVMDEPALTWFRREYTEPEPFPALLDGDWQSEAIYPPPDQREQTFFFGANTLLPAAPDEAAADEYIHRPTLGGRGSLCYGGGAPPNGLSRDLRPDEALSLTYTSAPLTEPLDVLGFPRVVLYVQSSAPVAHAVVRLTDVAPNGVSSQVSIGILNLTHRHGHANPQPLTPGEVYEIPISLKATGYRFQPGHRIRLSVASAYWPVIWPSPYAAVSQLHRGAATPSRLVLPVLPADRPIVEPPAFKTSPPRLIDVGEYLYEPPVWQIIEDVIKQSVTVKLYGGDMVILPNGVTLFNSEKLEMTAYHQEPAYARMYNEVLYKLRNHGYQTEIRATGSIHSTADAFHIDIQLMVHLNGNRFFEKSWLESIPRQLL